MNPNANVALFVDIADLYASVGRRFNSRKLDYKKLLEKVNEYGQVTRSIAYGTQIGDEAHGFISCLRMLGYDPKYKQPSPSSKSRRANWDVTIALDVARVLDRNDVIVICTSQPELSPLMQYIRDNGVRSIVIGSQISSELKESADRCIEIDEDWLEQRDQDEKQDSSTQPQ